MNEVKWIKLSVNMFDNRKIKHLRKMPDGNSIVLTWVMLLTMAGSCNANGAIFLTETIPYTTKMLAEEFGFSEDLIKTALQIMQQLEMLTVEENGIIIINGWEEHQNVNSMERIREQTKERVRKSREKAKANSCNATCNATVTQSNAIEEEREEDKEKEEEIEVLSNDNTNAREVKQVCERWNELGLNQLTKVKSGSTRHKMLTARIREYGIDEVMRALDNVADSSFLKGNNNKGWMITFDWFIAPNNFPKVLEGNYADKKTNYSTLAGDCEDEDDRFSRNEDLIRFCKQYYPDILSSERLECNGG